MFKFFTQKKWFLWSIFGSLFILISTWYQVQLDVKINEWFGQFYDTLQKALTTPNSVTELEFITKDPTKNPLMGWESSSDTLTELKLEFSSKELAINYAKKKKIDFDLIEPKKRKVVKKSYADNFLK